jgi:hypothetical protein
MVTSHVVATAGQSILPLDGSAQTRAYWPIAKGAHMDLHQMSMRRVNLLLMGSDGVIQDTLNRLTPKLAAPVRTWNPSDPLELPSPSQEGTLILREVGALPPIDQRRLLTWLEASVGRVQVVSTSSSRLLAMVDVGGFLETLYYRLNVVCLDMTT